jgi:hypothetical protein
MKYENEMFQDLMGIVIETNDKWLDKKLNGHVCYKGGNTTTTTVNVPSEFKPFARKYSGMLADKTNEFGAIGEESAALKQAQRQAVGMSGQLGQAGQATLAAQQAAQAGTGLFGQADLSGMAKELSRQAGITEAQRAGARPAGGGVPGSARDRIAQAEGRANLEGQFAKLGMSDLSARRSASQQAVGQGGAAQKAALGGVDVLRGVGKEQTARDQMMAEAPVRGLKEMGSIFTGIPMGQTSTGGGK